MPTTAEASSKAKASQRSLRWYKAQEKKGLCPYCANPAARSCHNKFCAKYRKPVGHVNCTSCGHMTERLRLCLTHLRQDRERKAA